MSDEPLMPSEVRRKVLSQHREIEQMLSELETGVDSPGRRLGNRCRTGETRGVRAPGDPGAAHELRGDAHGSGHSRGRRLRSRARSRHLHAEHADQRRAARSSSSTRFERRAPPTDLTKSGREAIATMLRNDIEEEERDYVNEKLLHDHDHADGHVRRLDTDPKDQTCRSNRSSYPTDFSENAQHALDYAMGLAKRCIRQDSPASHPSGPHVLA